MLTTGVVIGAIGAIKYAEHIVNTRIGELKIDLKPKANTQPEGVMEFNAELSWTSLKPIKMTRSHHVAIQTRQLDNSNIIIEVDDRDAVDFLGMDDVRNLVAASGYNQMTLPTRPPVLVLKLLLNRQSKQIRLSSYLWKLRSKKAKSNPYPRPLGLG